MPRHLALLAIAICLLANAVLAAEPVESGLRVGEEAVTFDVLDCSGPRMGGTLCYRCAYANRPVVAIFVRRLGDDVANLIKKVDDAVAKHPDKRPAAFVVYLADKPAGIAARLKKLSDMTGLAKTPLTLFPSSEGPDGYHLSPEADVTVLVWSDVKVRASRAFGKERLSEDDVKNVLDDALKVIK